MCQGESEIFLNCVEYLDSLQGQRGPESMWPRGRSIYITGPTLSRHDANAVEIGYFVRFPKGAKRLFQELRILRDAWFHFKFTFYLTLKLRIC